MPQLRKTPAKPTSKKTNGKTKTPAKAAPGKYAAFAQSSYDEPLEQSLVLLILGQLGVGKTTLAASASKHFPKKFPAARHKGKPKYVLSDMFWLSADRKATAGFRERGIAVPNFDIPHFMKTEGGAQGWRAAGFTKAPNIMQAAEFGLRVAAESQPTFLVVDTVSMLDRMFNKYWMDNTPTSGTGVKDTRGMYGQILHWHLKFSDVAMQAAPSVIFLCHTKVVGEAEAADEKARKMTMTTAAGGLLIPDITGKGQLPYKGNASAQLAMVAKPVIVNGKRGLKHVVSTIRTHELETKNRWELSLQAEEEPHLGKLFDKIRA